MAERYHYISQYSISRRVDDWVKLLSKTERINQSFLSNNWINPVSYVGFVLQEKYL